METCGSNCLYQYGSALHTDDYIGGGSFGCVYKATVTDRNEYNGKDIVAVKVIHLKKQTGVLSNPELYGRARDRLRSLIALRHKHVVVYHKVSITTTNSGATIELMMDLYDSDLAFLLHKLREIEDLLNEATVVRYSRELAEGTEYLHQNNIIHGDIKPANIMVKNLDFDQKRLLIGDLDDRVQMQQDITCSRDITHLRGTARYMSPEMLRKFATMNGEIYKPEILGRKTDIWSLGCVMLELAKCISKNRENWVENSKGQRANAGTISDAEFVTLIMHAGYVPVVPDSAPQGLTGCIRGCLQTGSESRLSASQLRTLLEQLRNSNIPLPSRTSPVKQIAVVLCDLEPNIQKPSRIFARVVDPDDKVIRQILLPEELQRKRFSGFFTAVDNDIVCQVRDPKGTEFETVAWNLITNTCLPIITADKTTPMHFPVAFGRKIYFLNEKEDAFNVMDFDSGTVLPLGRPRIPYEDRNPLGRRIVRGVRSGLHIVFLGTVTESSRSDDAPKTMATMWIVICLNTETGEWSVFSKSPKGETIKDDFDAAVLSETVYMLGASTSPFKPWTSCHCIDVQKQTIEKLCSFPRERRNPCLFVLNNRIYLLDNEQTKPGSRSQTVRVYHPQKDKWKPVVYQTVDDQDVNSFVYR
ncbi:uncharacterized protein LOC129594407 isoform X2 [Paramacrobiotus metropolitanus]|uniref:uncharacterized protein LOC129594407 isoform X2 n=1 Tax=Paramacrobiotus metropolitanus TaxID=2943436 RepID=UPI0024459E8D|nr:uncharacterized protein LOC129594407 isoform X2 [Paramacrobiotus metropolitanus]